MWTIVAVNSMEFNEVRPAPNIQFGDLRLGHRNQKKLKPPSFFIVEDQAGAPFTLVS